MARVFDRRGSQYLESPSTAGILGPPFWVALWFRVDEWWGEQALFFVGSRQTLQSYYAVVAKEDGTIAAVSVGPTDGRGEARLADPLEGGRWYPAVACWPSTQRRSIHLPAGQALHEGRVAVPYVDRLAVGRFSTALPSGYLSGAVARVCIGVGSPTAEQIEAILRGVDPRLVFRLGVLRVFLPLCGGDYDVLGRASFVAGGMPGWDKDPLSVTPSAAGLLIPSGTEEQHYRWASTKAGQVFVPQALAGQVQVPGVQAGMIWG